MTWFELSHARFPHEEKKFLIALLLLTLAVIELPIWGSWELHGEIVKLHVDSFLFLFSSFLSFNSPVLFLLANLVDSCKVYGTFGSGLPWSKLSSASLLRHIGPGPLWSGSVLASWGREYPVSLNNEAKRWLQRELAATKGDIVQFSSDIYTSFWADLWNPHQSSIQLITCFALFCFIL